MASVGPSQMCDLTSSGMKKAPTFSACSGGGGDDLASPNAAGASDLTLVSELQGFSGDELAEVW
jgi:hypothetical protein